MKPSKKRMKKSVQLLLILSLFFTGLASAQTEAETATQTTVLIEGGASAKTSNALKAKTELILQAINGTKDFPSESGVAQLKTIIEEKQLVSTLDTLGTVVIKSGKTFELPRIVLQKKGGKAWETTDLIFQYDSNYKLTGVRQSNVKRNIDRILSREIARTRPCAMNHPRRPGYGHQCSRYAIKRNKPNCLQQKLGNYRR